MKKLTEHHRWISTEVIKVLKHNLNFSNWTDTYACEGKWEIEFSNKESKIEIYMPTSRWGEEHSGFFTLYSGRIEFDKNKLLIWQNEETAVRLNYTEFKNHLTLTISGHSIQFKKKKVNV